MSRRDDLEEMVAWTMKYCQHYDPSGVTMIGGKEPHGHCKAGVVYLDQFGRAPKEDEKDHIAAGLGAYYPSAGIFQRICCTDGGKRSEEEQRAMCPKWLRATRDEGEQRFRELQDSDARFKKVMAVVGPWRKKLPRGKAEVIECPACNGRLHLSQAACNGHVHGHCETAGCVSWME